MGGECCGGGKRSVNFVKDDRPGGWAKGSKIMWGGQLGMSGTLVINCVEKTVLRRRLEEI